MTYTKRPKALPHVFISGQTVTGAINKINLHDVTPEEAKELMALYKQINPPVNPKPGVRALIPILDRHEERIFGNV